MPPPVNLPGGVKGVVEEPSRWYYQLDVNFDVNVFDKTRVVNEERVQHCHRRRPRSTRRAVRHVSVLARPKRGVKKTYSPIGLDRGVQESSKACFPGD